MGARVVSAVLLLCASAANASMALIMLLLLTTSAQAAPLYLKCEGEAVTAQAKSEPATISVTIDGTNVKVEDLAPIPIYSNDDDVWTFGAFGRVGHVCPRGWTPL